MSAPTTFTNDLQISQNKFAHFLLQQPKRSHAPDLFEILGWTNLKDRSDLNILCLVFKCLNGLAPTYLSENFVRSQRNNNLRIPGASNNCGKRTFIYRASVLWNSLPDELKLLDSWPNFKLHVSNFIVQRRRVNNDNIYVFYWPLLSGFPTLVLDFYGFLVVLVGSFCTRRAVWENSIPLCWRCYPG